MRPKKIGVRLFEDHIDEIKSEAKRLGLTQCDVLKRAWIIARREIAAIESDATAEVSVSDVDVPWVMASESRVGFDGRARKTG